MLGPSANQRLVSIVFAALLVTSATATPAIAATNDEPFFDGLVEDGKSGIAEQAAVKLASVTSWLARQDVPVIGDDSTGDATQYATDFEQTFNEHNGTIESYASERLNATTDYDVYAIYFHDKNGNNVTRYVVSDVANGNWQNARVVNQTEFDSLNRSRDHWVSLDWYQSKHADDELNTFVSDYATKDKSVSTGFKTKLLAKYGAPDSDMWSSNGSET